MEIFLDGGLFEFFAAVMLAYALNFIFLKKYLLILFSIVTIASPIFLVFFNKSELYYCLVSVCIFNSIFLIILLWKERIKKPNRPLFEIDRMKQDILRKFGH
jgi:hypothetical protein